MRARLEQVGLLAGGRPSHGALVAIGLACLILLPGLLPLDPYVVDLDGILKGPSPAHPLGTDENGRDALARLVMGARATIGIGVGATLVAIMLGTVIGAAAGYRGGLLDSVLMRCVDFALAFPSLFAILLFAAAFSPGPAQLVLLIGCTGWMTTARLVRARMKELLATPYVEAAWSLGASGREVICHHLIPNLHGILFVTGLVQLSRSILAEATISFLGFGVQPPPRLGETFSSAHRTMYTPRPGWRWRRVWRSRERCSPFRPSGSAARPTDSSESPMQGDSQMAIRTFEP